MNLDPLRTMSENATMPGEVTRLLQSVEGGDRSAAEELAPLVYHDPRAIASANLRSQRAHHPLSPTGLVPEAWLRLSGNGRPSHQDRKHFDRAAAITMRFILVGHAIDRNA